MCGYLSVARTFVLVKLIFPHKVNYQIWGYTWSNSSQCLLYPQIDQFTFWRKFIKGQWVRNKRNKCRYPYCVTPLIFPLSTLFDYVICGRSNQAVLCPDIGFVRNKKTGSTGHRVSELAPEISERNVTEGSSACLSVYWFCLFIGFACFNCFFFLSFWKKIMLANICFLLQIKTVFKKIFELVFSIILFC